MNEWKRVFEEVYSSSKDVFHKNKSFLYTISIILAIVSTSIVALSVYDLQSQGATFLESLNPENTDYVNSDYVTYSNIAFSIFYKLLYFIMFIFLFYKITNKNKGFSESIGHFFKKLIPLIFTWLIYIILIIPLFLLLIIPGIIFSILWMFFSYSVLFRNKNYWSALSYSKSLVSGKKLDTINNFIAFGFKMWKLWLLPFLLLFVIAFMNNTILYLSASFIAAIFFSVFYFYSIIFSIRYFLSLEKINGISNELDTNNTSNNELSQQELNAKNYIEQYKAQYPKESLRGALINAGHPASDVDNYLNKYY